MSGFAATSIWHVITVATHLAAAAGSLLAAAWLLSRRARVGAAHGALIASLLATALWALLAAATGGGGAVSGIAEALRNIVMLAAIYRMFAGDGRHTSVAPVRPVVFSLAFVELLLCALLLIEAGSANPTVPAGMFQVDVMFRLLATIGGLVLVQNLYAGASPQARLVLRWPAAGFGVLWLFDFQLYTVAYLLKTWPSELASLHGLPVLALVGLVALGGTRKGGELRLQPSRAVAFQSISLLAIGVYLLAMTALGQWVAGVGGDFARVVQFTAVVVAAVVALLIGPSARLRGWVRVTLVKHLFRHRYDYRQEWLRLTRTIGRADEAGMPLEERVVQAFADITDSPAGLLLTRDEDGVLVLAARWRWPTAEVPGICLDAAAIRALERTGAIVELEELRRGRDPKGTALLAPEWLLAESRAWALLPLLHFDRLVGAVVLARPPHVRRLDWEDFDLLRVVGQQLASYLAEHAGQQALAEAGRFDDFHRRIAFVMHDIKNLASQLSLLARNAERHAENPEFRADMLVTLRNSAEKLNALLARLSRYNAAAVEQLGTVDLAEVAPRIAAQFGAHHPVVAFDAPPCLVRANAESLEQVLVHLVQNAIDASRPDAQIFLRLGSDGLHGLIEVVDTGHGMSPDFVRNRLFKPFVSSKPGGFGIGAYEARELVRAMKGRIDVESQEGLGTRFTIRLPLTHAAELMDTFASEQRAAS
ncbi:MAG: XrtA/PEP-CTERM system histidine kinase PrsK [Novosphingobium sp.]